MAEWESVTIKCPGSNSGIKRKKDAVNSGILKLNSGGGVALFSRLEQQASQLLRVAFLYFMLLYMRFLFLSEMLYF